MSGSRRDEALGLAEDLLSDLELSRTAPTDLARKTSRLARLLDDVDAGRWLAYEVGGFPSQLDSDATRAAARSNRRAGVTGDGRTTWWTDDLAALQATVEACRTELAGAAASPPASGEWAPTVQRERTNRLQGLQNTIVQKQQLIDRVLGSFHSYVAAKYQGLRFGAAVETAFGVVRAQVDESIAELVPDALPKLSAAFENTTSDNPEDWASAAATCRRLLKAAADALRPPGPEVSGRKMGDEQYVNRLMDWVLTQSTSETAGELIAADVSYLGRRLDAVLDAGHKGAHAEVSRFDASRFVTGTYLLLGDVLSLRSEIDPPTATAV